MLGLKSLKNSGSHIDASHSRQPLVKGERLVRYEVNAVMEGGFFWQESESARFWQCKFLTLQVYCSFTLFHEPGNWLLSNLTFCSLILPQRVCHTWLGAMPGQHLWAHEQAQSDATPEKNWCDKQVSSWRHISCHTDKNRYYTWS